MPGLIDRWFTTSEILAVWNRNQIKFGIQGRVQVDGCENDPEPHMHVVFETDAQIFGVPEPRTLEDAINFFGWGMLRQVELVYALSDVPEDIVWTGYVMIGLSPN